MNSLDVKQSPNAQDAFQPTPGLISCTGVTGSVGVLCHAHDIYMYMCVCIFVCVCVYMYVCVCVYMYLCV